MTGLPSGWERLPLSELARAEYGKGLPATERRSSGAIPVYGSAGVVGHHDEALVGGPIVIVGRKGNAGECHVSPGPSWPIDTTYFLRVPAGIDPAFLGLQLSVAGLRALDSSTAVPSLRRPALEAVLLNLPGAPEQRRIVAAIEEQFSRLDAADGSTAMASQRLSMLEARALGDAFRGDWPWTTLGEIADLAGGVTKDSKGQDAADLVEVPYLRVANVQRGFLDLGTVTTIRVTPEKLAALALRPGDVLFNEGGDRDKLGRGWVWSGEIDPCIHQNHVFRARLMDGFEPRFVSWHGNTFGRGWFEANGRQTTNLASINLSTLRRFPVPAPPFDEQQRIVSELETRLSVLDSTRAVIVATQRRSAALRRSILERAFQGELVSQDPADEPASVLLERIRAERAAQPKPRRRRAIRT